jgi:hypothetical protein
MAICFLVSRVFDCCRICYMVWLKEKVPKDSYLTLATTIPVHANSIINNYLLFPMISIFGLVELPGVSGKASLL